MNTIITAFLYTCQREKNLSLLYIWPHCISKTWPHLHTKWDLSLSSYAVQTPTGSLCSTSFYSLAQQTVILKWPPVRTSGAGSSIRLCCVIIAESRRKNIKQLWYVNRRVNLVLWTFQDRNSDMSLYVLHLGQWILVCSHNCRLKYVLRRIKKLILHAISWTPQLHVKDRSSSVFIQHSAENLTNLSAHMKQQGQCPEPSWSSPSHQHQMHDASF